MYFEYGEKEIEYLKRKDKRLGDLYLWAIAGGAIPEMRDCAPRKAGK
jgi:hypothetical protein